MYVNQLNSITMNKRIYLLCSFVLFFLTGWTQISTIKIEKPLKEDFSGSYDSTKNYLGEKVYQYIGQELYLNGVSESLRKYGYRGFYLDYKSSNLSRYSNTYKPKQVEDRYLKYDIGGGVSEYDSIVGKYFKVLEIYKHPQASDNEYLYGDKYYLKLKEKNSGDILFFEYSSEFKHTFPFLVVGYFEKMKRQCTGRKFVFANNYINGNKNINTGKEIVVYIGDKWKCIDISVEEENFSLSAIMTDSHNQKIAVNLEDVFECDNSTSIFTSSFADKKMAKYGITNWNLILNGRVKIGWTKEMCKLSWGEPNDINSTLTSRSKHEQWVYEDNYLYFDNGILTTIQ